MGRKRKQVEPGVATILPPCRVCGAPGSGLHYGVNTCEACKGFFHRSLKIWTQYRCDKTGQCPVEPGRSKLCHLCRYNRCLAAGMAKEAIKTGRYSSTKRTKDILEIRQLQEKQTLSTTSVDRQIPEHLSQTGTFIPIDEKQRFGSDSQAGNVLPLYRNSSDQFSSGCVLNFIPELSDSLILCDGPGKKEAQSFKEGTFVGINKNNIPHVGATNNHTKTTSSDNSSVYGIESLLFLNKEEIEQLQGQQLQSQFLSTSSLTPSSLSSPEEVTSLSTEEETTSVLFISSSSLALESTSSSTSPRDTQHLSGDMLEQAASMPFTLSSPTVSESNAYNVFPTTSLTPPTQSVLSPLSLASSPSIAHSATSSLLQTDSQDAFFDCSVDSSSIDVALDFVTEIYSDKDMIIRTLVAANESSLIPIFGQMTDEEILQQQLEHLEACRLKREMFGPLKKLPDHEYDYIFVTTGLDTDDRQKLFNNMGECLEKMIRAMVKFCKAIPGFSKLHISDRIKLIKYSRQEFYIFLTYKCVDKEKKILRGFDCQWKCENELLRLPSSADTKIHIETLEGYFQFCHTLRSLNLSDSELVVIRALIAMAPDRDKPVNSALAREIHWQLTLTLIHLLSQRYPNPFSVFARIMDRLTEARTQTEGVIFFLKKMKMDKYSHLMYNPLLKEMFGGIFFNNDEDDWAESV